MIWDWIPHFGPDSEAGFWDLRLDYGISGWILGVRAGFWISGWILGFRGGLWGWIGILGWILGLWGWILGFETGFRDFGLDPKISKCILGFGNGF